MFVIKIISMKFLDAQSASVKERRSGLHLNCSDGGFQVCAAIVTAREWNLSQDRGMGKAIFFC